MSTTRNNGNSKGNQGQDKRNVEIREQFLEKGYKIGAGYSAENKKDAAKPEETANVFKGKVVSEQTFAGLKGQCNADIELNAKTGQGTLKKDNNPNNAFYCQGLINFFVNAVKLKESNQPPKQAHKTPLTANIDVTVKNIIPVTGGDVNIPVTAEVTQEDNGSTSVHFHGETGNSLMGVEVQGTLDTGPVSEEPVKVNDDKSVEDEKEQEDQVEQEDQEQNASIGLGYFYH